MSIYSCSPEVFLNETFENAYLCVVARTETKSALYLLDTYILMASQFKSINSSSHIFSYEIVREIHYGVAIKSIYNYNDN